MLLLLLAFLRIYRLLRVLLLRRQLARLQLLLWWRLGGLISGQLLLLRG
jgi:hypothetical protein